MQILSAINPRATKNGILLTVDTAEFGVIEFHAIANDTEKHGRDLHAAALAGDFGAIVPYVQTQAEKNAKADRAYDAIVNSALAELFEYVAAKADAPISLKNKKALAVAEKAKKV